MWIQARLEFQSSRVWHHRKQHFITEDTKASRRSRSSISSAVPGMAEDAVPPRHPALRAPYADKASPREAPESLFTVTSE